MALASKKTTKKSSAVGVKKVAVKKKRVAPFISSFKAVNYSKGARAYHHEVLHLIMDLQSINRRVSASAASCKYQLDLISKKKTHLFELDKLYESAEETVYQLENFAFRASAFRDKLCQFINQALMLGYDERESGMVNKLLKNRISIRAHTDTEIKIFNTQQGIKDIISKRVKLSHLKNYSPEYSPYLSPSKDQMNGDLKKATLIWRTNVVREVEKTDSAMRKFMEIANNVMKKIENFRKKESK